MTTYNSIRLVQTTNPLKLVECPELHNSLVYETGWLPAHSATQLCMIMMDSKGSYPMFVKTRKDYKDGYGCEYANFIKNYTEQQLVENGRSGLIREVFAVDIDEVMDLHTIWTKLKEINIPVSYVITQNRSSLHWQIQFYVEPIIIKDLKWTDKKIPDIIETFNYKEYVKLTMKLSKYFKQYFNGSDSKYKGVMCRNIYHTNQFSYVINNGRILRLKDTLGQKPVVVDSDIIDEWMNSEVLNVSDNNQLRLNEVEIPSDSRHELTLNLGRKFMWKMIREQNSPSESDLFEYIVSVKDDIGIACNKESHSIKEIESQVHSIYKWSMEHYNPLYQQTSGNQWECSRQWNINQRSAKIKRAKLLKRRFLFYKNTGKNITEIAQLLGMSVVTLYSYLPLFAVVDLVVTVNRFGKMMLRRCWEEIISDINLKIIELHNNMKEFGLDWGKVNYMTSVEDYEHIVDYNIDLNGNRERLAS